MTSILAVGFMYYCIMLTLTPCDCEGDWPRYDKTKQLQLQRDNVTVINDGMSYVT
jgi:hypothetical protein